MMTHCGNCGAPFNTAGPLGHVCQRPFQIIHEPADHSKLVEFAPVDPHAQCRAQLTAAERRAEQAERELDAQHDYACRMDALAEERLAALSRLTYPELLREIAEEIEVALADWYLNVGERTEHVLAILTAHFTDKKGGR